MSATVRATYSGQDVFVGTRTDLNWRTTVVLTTTPVPMTPRSAEQVLALARRDESLSDVRVEVTP